MAISILVRYIRFARGKVGKLPRIKDKDHYMGLSEFLQIPRTLSYYEQDKFFTLTSSRYICFYILPCGELFSIARPEKLLIYSRAHANKVKLCKPGTLAKDLISRCESLIIKRNLTSEGLDLFGDLLDVL